MWGVEVRPTYCRQIMVVVVLVVVRVVGELALLRVSVLRIAVELSCPRRPPSRVGGGSAQAEQPRKGRCWDGGALKPSRGQVLLEVGRLVWVARWWETRGSP